MLIIMAGSRWAGNAGRAAGWRAGTFGCGDANQAAGEGEEEREARGEGEFTDAKSASERTESGRLPATRDEISEQLYFAVWLLQGKREKKGGGLGVSEAGGSQSARPLLGAVAAFWGSLRGLGLIAGTGCIAGAVDVVEVVVGGEGEVLSTGPGACVICMLPWALVQQNSCQAGVVHICAEWGGGGTARRAPPSV